MDDKTLGLLATVGGFCFAVLGGIVAWLLANERRLARLEKGQESMETAIAEIRTAIQEGFQSVQERLDTYFANHKP